MLSELKIMDKWASVLTEYKSIGERIFEFARAIEAEVRKQDDALILQLVEALDGVHAGEHQGGVDEAITAGRARLEGRR